jgi:2-methylaconitate cis-trans-isomerase PrpF
LNVNSLLQKAAAVNQNGAINGRSIPHSDLTEAERVQLAADAVTATHPYIPTVKVSARDFGTTSAKISAELDRRAVQLRVEQVRRLAEALRCLPTHLRDAVIEAAGVGIVWDSVDRLTR